MIVLKLVRPCGRCGVENLWCVCFIIFDMIFSYLHHVKTSKAEDNSALFFSNKL